jgi:hypothetical protein
VKDLKAWTLRSMIRTDIIMRAFPWARLILSTGTAPVALNLRTAGRWSVALTALALVLTVLSPLEPFLLLLAGVVVAAIIALNAGFQDHAMLTGILAARNHGAGERNDVWKVNADQDYHEEERRPAVLEPSLAER